MNKTATKIAGLSVLALASAARAAQPPADGWIGDNQYGGIASITVSPNRVSFVLKEDAIISAGGGSLLDLVKQLLERYAPGLCSDILNFEQPHKDLTVSVAVRSEISPSPGASLFVVGKERSLTFDYVPSRNVRCNMPGRPNRN